MGSVWGKRRKTRREKERERERRGNQTQITTRGLRAIPKFKRGGSNPYHNKIERGERFTR